MPITLPILVFLGQVADGLAYRVAYGRGVELNPLAAAIDDPTALLLLKTGAGLILGLGSWVLVRRGRRTTVTCLALIGFVGALSGVWSAR